MSRQGPEQPGRDQRPRQFAREGHTLHQRAAEQPPVQPRGAEQQFDAPTYYVPREPDEPSATQTQRLPNPGEATTQQVPTTAPRDSPERPRDPVNDGRQHTAPVPHAAAPANHAPEQPGMPPPMESPGAAGAPPGPYASPVVPGEELSNVAGKVTVTRAVAARSQQAARYVTNKVVAASKADGAGESGMTPLIWNQVLSFGADAMITVALAGTVFFSAAKSDQRGNVLGYLLITMAPFAVVAPVIGPVLDRFQHGRRGAMAVSAFGRAALAILMAQNFNNLYALFPLALGSLVLSKAYSVVRAAAAPRLVPQGMSLVTANARLSLFGLGAMLIGGGFIGAIIKVTGSYWLGLWLTAIPFAATGVFALKLPKQVDSAAPAPRHPEEPPRPGEVVKVPPIGRIRSWASRGYGPPVVTALQGASMLRFSTGFLTLFLAFWIQNAAHGLEAASQLGAIGAGVGIGNAVGTALGARVHLGHPDRLVIFCCGITALACTVTALTFGLIAAVICMFFVAAVNSLGKVSLDAVIQRDVRETYRSSAFARSETFLQLAWVIGATIAILLPIGHGALGLGVAAAVTCSSVAYIVIRSRATNGNSMRSPGVNPGTV
ncbi:MAG: MFS transporter [Jatrophihabitans sp.]